jgi:hypothetical protein
MLYKRSLSCHFPRQELLPFVRARIEWLGANQRGCYGIVRQRGWYQPDLLWIYVGKGNLRTNLLAHFHGDNPDILKYGPTHFVTEVTDSLDAREKQLIIELKPVANKRIG